MKKEKYGTQVHGKHLVQNLDLNVWISNHGITTIKYIFIFSVDMSLMTDTDDNLKHHKEASQTAANREKANVAVSW